MKRLIAIGILLGCVFSVLGQPTMVAPATQAEVDAGIVARKYVSPLTLNNWSGAAAGIAVAAGTNGVLVLTNGSGTLVTISFSGTFDSMSALNAFLTNVYMGNLTVTNFYMLTNSAPVTALTNAFALDTRYTNADQRAMVFASVELTSAATGTAAVTLSVEQGNGVTNNVTARGLALSVGTIVEELSMRLSPLARYTFKTTSSGSGTTVAMVSTNCAWIGD